MQIFYLVTDSPQHLEGKQEEEIEVVPASSLTHSLVFLDKYTQYRIQVLAFNPAGDGPRTPAITVRTKQDIPGPCHNLQFTEITMTSLRVSWDPPKSRNGDIIGYIVTYETAEQNDRKYYFYFTSTNFCYKFLNKILMKFLILRKLCF